MATSSAVRHAVAHVAGEIAYERSAAIAASAILENRWSYVRKSKFDMVILYTSRNVKLS